MSAIIDPPLPRELTGGEDSQGGGIARAGERLFVIKNTYGADSPGREAGRIRHRNEAVMIKKLNANRRSSDRRGGQAFGHPCAPSCQACRRDYRGDRAY